MGHLGDTMGPHILLLPEKSSPLHVAYCHFPDSAQWSGISILDVRSLTSPTSSRTGLQGGDIGDHEDGQVAIAEVQLGFCSAGHPLRIVCWGDARGSVLLVSMYSHCGGFFFWRSAAVLEFLLRMTVT